MAMRLCSFVYSLSRMGWLVAALWVTHVVVGLAQEPSSSSSVLRLQGGDTYRGNWAASKNSQEMMWTCPSFLQPISFPWDSVQLVQIQDVAPSAQPEAPLASNPFCAELRTGEIVSGQLVSIQSDRVELDVPQIGKVTLPIDQLRYLLRIIPGGSEAVQVLSAQDWEQVLPATRNGRATKWYLKAGEISTDTSGTTITQWAQLPELATIDLDVAWDQASPNWWLTLGEPRRMELQVRKLQNKKILNVTLLLENSADADVTSIQLPYEEDQSIKLRLLCDANKGVYVLMRDNQVLGRLKGNIKERFVGRTKISFTNTALGVLTLRDLRISRNAFSLPSEVAEADPNRAGGRQTEWMTKARGTFFGNIVSENAEAASGSVKVQGIEKTPIPLSFDEIERIEFPVAELVASNTTNVELRNGLRFATNRIASRTDESFSGIELDVTDKKLQIPLSDIKRISRRASPVLDEPQPTTVAQSEKLVVQRLITDDAVSTGRIASVVDHSAESKTFAWQAKHATQAVPLNPKADGAIEPMLLQLAGSAQKRSTKAAEPMATLRADGTTNENDFGRSLKPDDPSLFLFSGDCFPAVIRRGDSEEFFFESSLFPKQSIAQSLVRGVRFVDYRGTDKLDRATRLRLLTLPRVQRTNPPTHLLVSRDGDMLRGKLVLFDRDQLVMDVRGEQRTVLVKNIAELIALDPAPKLESPTQESPTQDSPAQEGPNQETNQGTANTDSGESTPAQSTLGDVYQVHLEQGARVSIRPVSVDAESLKGTHPQLGECSLPWNSIVRISLGDAIAADASLNRFGKWKLQHAPDPKFVSEPDGPNDRPNDTPQMRMIGQGAPEFDLMKLDGTPFKLKENRGKILIVDFWATWCGPCIRSIPSLIEISKEFKDAGVELVLVNCEEPENRVRPFLERLKSIPTVVLDSDGTVSKQYNVAAIPQTVLIDRDGGIVEVLIGASDENEEILRKKITELIKQ